MSSRDNLNVLGKIEKCKTFSVLIEKDIANIEKMVMKDILQNKFYW